MKSKLRQKLLCGIRSAPRRRRHASVMVCVLVVLIVTAALALQGAQLLNVMSRSTRERARLEQAQELLALGRQRLSEQLRRGSEYEGESIRVELSDLASTISTSAEIRIRRVPAATTQRASWRIEASYPYNEPVQVTASWESPR